MTRNALRPCPVCLHTLVSTLHFQRFLLQENHPLAAGYEVVCCENCGFVYADSAVTQQDYDRFYASFSKYEDKLIGTGGGESLSDAERLDTMAKCIADFVPNRAARLLDIGCANGGLLARLKAMGFANVCGFDLPAACVEHTKKLGIEAYTGSVTQHPPAAGKFDLIILSHVMEHLRDLHKAVQGIERLLQKGGQIYIEVPDASEYAAHVMAPFQDFNTEHINHFSMLGMKNLMGHFGFEGRGVSQKVFDATPGMTYPAHYAFWSKTRETPLKLEHDDMLVKKIAAYIATSRAKMDQMDARLKRALARSPEIIVWGTGQLAMKLLVETSLAQANVVAFVDGNPINAGKKLQGKEIRLPTQLAGLSQPIVITTTLHQQAIAERIRNELRLSNEIIFLEAPKPK